MLEKRYGLTQSIYVFRTGKSEFFLKTCEAALKCRLILLLWDEGGGLSRSTQWGFSQHHSLILKSIPLINDGLCFLTECHFSWTLLPYFLRFLYLHCISPVQFLFDTIQWIILCAGADQPFSPMIPFHRNVESCFLLMCFPCCPNDTQAGPPASLPIFRYLLTPIPGLT